MTKDSPSKTVALRALLSQAQGTQLLAGMLGFVPDRLMALDVYQLCGAGVHELSDDRVNRRNGYRARASETRAGRVDVQIPKLRNGSDLPDFPEPRREAQKSMTAVIQEACIQGLSTRSVVGLVKPMGMTGDSKRQVSRLCGEIDDRVNAFLDRPVEAAQERGGAPDGSWLARILAHKPKMPVAVTLANIPLTHLSDVLPVKGWHGWHTPCQRARGSIALENSDQRRGEADRRPAGPTA